MHLLLASALAVTLASAQSSYRISENGCQCTSKCFISFGIISKYCTVNTNVCTDAAKKSDGKDKCGSLGDLLPSWSDATGSVKDFSRKIGDWSEENIAKIPTDQLLLMYDKTLDQLDGSRLAAIKDRLANISLEDLKANGKVQWDKIPFERLKNFGKGILEAIPTSTAGNWGKEKWLAFDKCDAFSFTGDQLKAGGSALGKLTKEQLSRYDWASVDDKVLATLPDELKTKVDQLAEGPRNIDYKAAKEKAAKAKNDVKAKLEARKPDIPATKEAYDASVSASKAASEAFKTKKDAAICAVGCRADTCDGLDATSAVARAVPAVMAVVLVVAASM